MNHSRPETTAGVFLEHFDLSPPLDDSREWIIYGHLFRTAREAADAEGWTFRSYSSRETPGTDEDFLGRKIRSFPTLILYRDGVELGRHTAVASSVEGIKYWGNELLGFPVDTLTNWPPPVPASLAANAYITESGEVLRRSSPAPGPILLPGADETRGKQ